jgi:REP element-mobilizing transposase RayT
MPRKLRVQYPGAMYHVMSRGGWREDIFLDDVDRQDFLKTLAEACQKTDWQIHAYCLMRNHYHLVLETPDANLVAGMAWLQSCVMGSDTAANRQEFERRMETRKLAVTDEAA